MNKRYVLIIVVVLIIPFFLFKKKDTSKALDNLNSKEGIFIYGDYVTYVDVGDVYVEEGARALDKNGRSISEDIITTYYTGKRQVFNIDSSHVNNYTVKYQIFDDDMSYETTRVVVVRDVKGPTIEEISPIEVNLNDVSSFDEASKVIATDESLISKVVCSDLNEELEQVIKCDVFDIYDNKSSINYLVKVVKKDA